MEVIKDALWLKCFEDAKRIQKNDTHASLLADCTWRLKKRYERCSEEKQKRIMIVLDRVPTQKQVVQPQTLVCGAVMMTGKKCTFKAVCGSYCRKHRIGGKVELGDKPVFNTEIL